MDVVSTTPALDILNTMLACAMKEVSLGHKLNQCLLVAWQRWNFRISSLVGQSNFSCQVTCIACVGHWSRDHYVITLLLIITTNYRESAVSRTARGLPATWLSWLVLCRQLRSCGVGNTSCHPTASLKPRNWLVPYSLTVCKHMQCNVVCVAIAKVVPGKLSQTDQIRLLKKGVSLMYMYLMVLCYISNQP